MNHFRPKFAQAIALGGTLLGIWSCSITDGPNATGEDFLSEQNLFLASELKSVSFEYPVDDFWIENTKSDYLGKPSLIVSDENGFKVKSRFSQLVPYDSAQNNLDEWGGYDSLHLILGLEDLRSSDSLPVETALQELLASLDGHKMVVRSVILDSISLAGFEAALSGVDEDEQKDLADSLTDGLTQTAQDLKMKLQESALIYWDSMETVLPGLADSQTVYVADTLEMKSPGDNPFAHTKFLLPHTLAALNQRSTQSKSQWIFTELELSGDNSSPLTFRYKVVFANDEEEGLLVLSRTDSEDKLIRKPLPITTFNWRGEARAAINQYYSHSQKRDMAAPALLTGEMQGVHFLIDRSRFMEVLLEADPSLDFKTSSEGYIVSHYIPFAEFTIPLDTSEIFIEKNHIVDIRLSSILDSLPPISEKNPEVDDNGYPVRTLKIDDQASAAHYGIINATTGEAVDSLRVSYVSTEDDRRLMLYEFANNPLQNDTLEIIPGISFEHDQFYYGFFGTVKIKFRIDPQNETLTFQVYKENRAVIEPNLSEESESLIDNLSRFVSPQASETKLRATLGMQRLINLAGSEHPVSHDFYLSAGAAYARQSDTAWALSYSPLAHIPLKLNGEGKLVIGIEVYFYEL